MIISFSWSLRWFLFFFALYVCFLLVSVLLTLVSNSVHTVYLRTHRNIGAIRAQILVPLAPSMPCVHALALHIPSVSHCRRLFHIGGAQSFLVCAAQFILYVCISLQRSIFVFWSHLLNGRCSSTLHTLPPSFILTLLYHLNYNLSITFLIYF